MRKMDPTTRMVTVDGKQYAVTKKDVEFFLKLAANYKGVEIEFVDDPRPSEVMKNVG